MNFTQLPLHQDVLKGIEAAGFTTCMPVQEKVLPKALENRDVMVQSKTGSGKTAVFLIAFLQKYVENREKKNPPHGLIIAPTRELAVQIEQDAHLLASHIPTIRIGCFYGRTGYTHQD